MWSSLKIFLYLSIFSLFLRPCIAADHEAIKAASEEYKELSKVLEELQKNKRGQCIFYPPLETQTCFLNFEENRNINEARSYARDIKKLFSRRGWFNEIDGIEGNLEEVDSSLKTARKNEFIYTTSAPFAKEARRNADRANRARKHYGWFSKKRVDADKKYYSLNAKANKIENIVKKSKRASFNTYREALDDLSDAQKDLAEIAYSIHKLYKKIKNSKEDSNYPIYCEKLKLIFFIRYWVLKNAEVQRKIGLVYTEKPEMKTYKCPLFDGRCDYNKAIDKYRGTDDDFNIIDPSNKYTLAYQKLNNWALQAGPLLPEIIDKALEGKDVKLSELNIDGNLSKNLVAKKFTYREYFVVGNEEKIITGKIYKTGKLIYKNAQTTLGGW